MTIRMIIFFFLNSIFFFQVLMSLSYNFLIYFRNIFWLRFSNKLCCVNDTLQLRIWGRGRGSKESWNPTLRKKNSLKNSKRNTFVAVKSTVFMLVVQPFYSRTVSNYSMRGCSDTVDIGISCHFQLWNFQNHFPNGHLNKKVLHNRSLLFWFSLSTSPRWKCYQFVIQLCSFFPSCQYISFNWNMYCWKEKFCRILSDVPRYNQLFSVFIDLITKNG